MGVLIVLSFFRIALTFFACLLALPILILIELFKSVFSGQFERYKGKTVLVTGAGNGLGREMAIQLARKKCKVLCVDMKEHDVNETVEFIGKENIGFAKQYICDITDRDAVAEMRDSVLAEFGKIDLVINNAAFLYLMPITLGTDEHIRRCIDVNVLGATWITRAFLPSMKTHKSGQILFINSLAAITTIGSLCTYNMTKSALLTLAWSLRDELDSNPEWKKIKVSSALPWFIDSHPAYRNFYQNNLFPMSVEYTASSILEGARRGFTEFAVPGGQLGTRINFLLTKVFPRSFIKLLMPSIGVEIGRPTNEAVFDKLTSPDYAIRVPGALQEEVYVKFAEGERKVTWTND